MGYPCLWPIFLRFGMGWDLHQTKPPTGSESGLSHWLSKFKKKEINGVRKTIVTALSHAFPREPERTKYRAQLYRIGLKWRNDQWELSGLYGAEGRHVMSIRKTKVWQASGVSMSVPAYTILGTYRRSRNGLTEFKSVDGRILYVQTMYVKYLKNDPGN